MPEASTISPAIVETLYEDALLLAEEARAVFDEADAPRPLTQTQGEPRAALSGEALRTTTRIMHALAWLLNQRAYFAGEMSEFQLRHHGRLPPAQPESDPVQLALLDDSARDVVERSCAFYSRVARLDRAWRDQFAMQPTAVHRLRQRIGSAFATG